MHEKPPYLSGDTSIRVNPEYIINAADDLRSRSRMKDVLISSNFLTSEIVIHPRLSSDDADSVESNWVYDKTFVDWLVKKRFDRQREKINQSILIIDYNSAAVFEVSDSLSLPNSTEPPVFMPDHKVPILHPSLVMELKKYGGRPNPSRSHPTGFRRGRAERWLNEYIKAEDKKLKRTLHDTTELRAISGETIFDSNVS